MNKAKQLLADLDYLEKAGLTIEQLRSLHHWSDRRERAERVSFSIARNYFAKEMTLKKNNAAFADRLRLVADLHHRSFAAFVELGPVNTI